MNWDTFFQAMATIDTIAIFCFIIVWVAKWMWGEERGKLFYILFVIAIIALPFLWGLAL